MEEKQLNVEGMSCNHCKAAVEEAVSKINGVNHVNADPSNNTVDIQFNGDASVLEDAEKAIYDAGYDVVK